LLSVEEETDSMTDFRPTSFPSLSSPWNRLPATARSFLLNFSLVLCFCLRIQEACAADQPFELQEGDRVIWLGSEFTEQATKHNFVEAALTARWPDRHITFRNLGWAGDRPNAIARGYFGGAEEGYRRLLEELNRLHPTVIFIEYGENAAYAGPEGVSSFLAEFKRLIRDLRPITSRLILVSPPAAEKLAPPLPDPADVNAGRQIISAELKAFAEAEHLRYVDLLTPLLAECTRPDHPPLTTDTIRYNARGYAAAARAYLNSLGVPGFQGMEFQAELRELIRAKNDLYFHQYRPQNETYLRGFRKHEQGQNAKEIPQFDPLIQRAEERIAAFVQGKPLPEILPVQPFPESDYQALTPEEQVKQFKLAEGLEIAPFAAEPFIGNPIHMNFDGRGRLWVATSPIYPQIRPGAVPEDEIIILEDTDGDNRADRRTVFASGLLIPTAVLPDEQGGAYVANSTELVHLADRDGDGRADERTVVLSGFGTEDTHHILHTFRWTPDALLSFNQSIYIHSQIETPYGVQEMLGSGIWRYRPETARANTVAFGLINPWGYIFDRWGQSFATDGAGGEGINYIFPGAAYPTAVGYDRVLAGMNPGQPKFCGLEILTGDHFNKDYQQTLVTADFRGNRICRFRITPEGSGYVSTQLEDVLACNDRAFRPVDLKLAPDGTLYIADWHNPIINHGEVDFRDPRRDHKHGRIWRITQTGQPVPSRPEIAGMEIDPLLNLLTSHQTWTRQMARVHLRQHKPAEVLKAAQQWLAKRNPADPDYEQLRLEILWTCQAIGSVPPELLQGVLKSSDHRARAAAVRVLSQATHENYGLPSGFDAVPLLEAAVKDSHPQVRLEAVNALRDVSQARSMELALHVMDQPMDTWLDYALWLTARKLEPFWGPEVASGKASFFDQTSRLLFVLKASDKPSVLLPLMEVLTAGKVSEKDLPEVLSLIGKFAGASEARILFDRALSHSEQRRPLLATLATMAQKRQIIPQGDLSPLANLFPDFQALHLAGLWKLTQYQPQLTAIALSKSSSLPERAGAIQGLSALKAQEVLHQLARDSQEPFAVRRRAVTGLYAADPRGAIAAAIILLTQAQPADEVELDAFLNVLFAEKEGPNQLAAALGNAELPAPVKDLLGRKAGSLGNRGTRLLQALHAGMSTPPKQLSPAEIAELLAQVKTHGSPLRGENLFRRKDLACLSCHSIGGAGGEAGPDLRSLGASSPVDYILDSLLHPSAKIKEGYHTNTIALEDGKVLSGILVREGNTELVLRDAQNRQIIIPKSEIDERAVSPTSLMPADLTAKLNHNQLLDLVVFLSSLGKEGAWQVPQNRFVRRWTNTDGSELFSRVDGSLHSEEAAGKTLGFEIDVSTPGKIALKLKEPGGLQVTHQGQPVPIFQNMAVMDLPVGRQSFQITIPEKRPIPVQIEVVETASTTGHAEPANRP